MRQQKLVAYIFERKLAKIRFTFENWVVFLLLVKGGRENDYKSGQADTISREEEGRDVDSKATFLGLKSDYFCSEVRNLIESRFSDILSVFEK